jgi:hypothetical protein
MVTLLRSGLINTAQLDQQLAKFIYSNPRPFLLAFMVENAFRLVPAMGPNIPALSFSCLELVWFVLRLRDYEHH